MINSYDRDKFEDGKEYWTYYMGVSSKGNKLRDYTGIVHVRFNRKIQYAHGGELDFTILDNPKLSNTMQHNLSVYMRGYGMASCDFYETYDMCVCGHDHEIMQRAQPLNSTDRTRMLKKIIGVDKPNISSMEVDSIKWFQSLPLQNKKYVAWLKQYYEERELTDIRITR